MNPLIFDNWGGKVIDNRGNDARNYTAVIKLELPLLNTTVKS